MWKLWVVQMCASKKTETGDWIGWFPVILKTTCITAPITRGSYLVQLQLPILCVLHQLHISSLCVKVLFRCTMNDTSYSRWWCWPSRPSTELHPSTSKHWSDHAPQCEHIAESKQGSLSKVTTLLCSCTLVVERTPDQCQDGRTTRHLPQKTQDSFAQCSFQPCIAWLPT